jgi:hypothetical protein
LNPFTIHRARISEGASIVEATDMAKPLSDLKRFLDAATYDESQQLRKAPQRGLNPFVTISREFGAGGRRLARELLAVMHTRHSPAFQGWKIFDRELCEQLAEEPELRSSVNRLVSEEYQSEVEALVVTFLGEASAQSLLIRRLFETIRTLATVGKVIIVGRAGSCVTGSLPLGVHLRLTASGKSKIRRMKLSGLPDGEALKALGRRDSDRARLVRTHFHKNIADPSLYDVVWNTDRVPFHTISECTISLIETKLEERGQ